MRRTRAQKKLRTWRANDGRARAAPDLPTIILDGLLGLGAKPPLREPITTACREINRLRRDENAFVFAIDLPTGLDGDSGEADPDCVIADFTLTIGFAKRGLLADRALDYVGRIERIPLADLALAGESRRQSSPTPRHSAACFRAAASAPTRISSDASASSRAPKVSPAPRSSALPARLRGGAGLVELFVPEEIYDIVASAAPPEVMVKPISLLRRAARRADRRLGDRPGPRPGARGAKSATHRSTRRNPMVVDADALNILAPDPTDSAAHAPARACSPRIRAK